MKKVWKKIDVDSSDPVLMCIWSLSYVVLESKKMANIQQMMKWDSVYITFKVLSLKVNHMIIRENVDFNLSSWSIK